MSIDTETTGRHTATGTATDGTRIYLDTATGEPVADETLIAWRHAAVTGGLPEPSRHRWQQLRAGVVNMWEFDAAEYWSADGRAQFVGRNEQGKSSMMAMTTLTMLTGDLSPRYVDTFGESHRTFRYYVEPSDDAKDRRPTDNQLNRGWTWVEYGRLTDTGPEYFTTLLFVQARRTSPDYTKRWITHTGPERVRAGITLLHQHSVVTPADMPTQPSMTVHPGGRAYARTVASTLFGLTDPERLRTVVELLKTLRTPKLGNRLEPGWVIDRIREALPPLDTAEINGLAEGWDQLGQLAADRDAAKEAQEAVTAYVKSTWNPWADATLRLAADDLVAAVTAHDDVTRAEREARGRAKAALDDLQKAQESAEGTDTEHAKVTQRRETLLRSQSYRDAVAAGGQVKEEDDNVKALTKALEREAGTQRRAHSALGEAQTAHDESQEALDSARDRAATQATTTGRTASAAGLPADSTTWAAAFDTARLEAAVNERRHHLGEARKLDTAGSRAREAANRDAELLTAAEKRHTIRTEAAEEADAAFDVEKQRLSDELERWVENLAAAGIEVAAPPVPVRERWLDTVLAECDRPRPVQRLTALVLEQWTEPAVAPLADAAAKADHEATAAAEQADEADEDADRIENQPTPVPATPHLWGRRTRPASGPDGAPLWELLDPVDDLPADTVAGLEAGLAGAGLLDAWVTADGVWRPDRDGRDHVISLPATPTAGDTLSSVLQLAEPVHGDGPLAALADTAGRVLSVVGWCTSPDAPAPTDDTWVAADGSWGTRTTTGRAEIPASGATLLGATARAQDRARRVAARRAEAEQHRARAAELKNTAERHRATVAQLRRLGGDAPGDADVLGAGQERANAHRELEQARHDRDERTRAAQKSETAAAEANAALLSFCADKHLDPARLPEAGEALNRAADSVQALASASSEVGHADRLHQVHVTQLRRAVENAEAADTEVQDLERKLAVAKVALQAARDAMEATDQAVLDEVDELAVRLDELTELRKKLTASIIELSGQLATAESELASTQEKRETAERERGERLAAWWVPVDAGLAAVRGVKLAEEGARTLTAALTQARTLRAEKRPPRGWPDTAVTGERDLIVSRLRDELVGAEYLKLNSTLNRTGGRSAVLEHDDVSGLPQIRVLVDASNTRFDPNGAIAALAEKSAQLGELHDEQMHKVMEELLASTFVDHLRDKVKQTEALLHDVNGVLAKHPTGTTRTVLRLRRKPVAQHTGGYQVLNRLLEGSVDSPAVQQQVQAFLSGQIRAAQDEGNAEGRDWKELLVDKLDYRCWFAVVTEWRVLASAKEGATSKWEELTRERHGQDSGGGKVMTMVQPLLATLAALYENSPTAPRPLWLDEAFDGVDAENTNSLLGMLVDFDFDFVLAGPKAQVASRHVPCAAVWMVNRAPAPMPGVDLGLWLYGGGTQEKIDLGEQTWADTTAGHNDDSDGGGQHVSADGADTEAGEETLWR